MAQGQKIPFSDDVTSLFACGDKPNGDKPNWKLCYRLVDLDLQFFVWCNNTSEFIRANKSHISKIQL